MFSPFEILFDDSQSQLMIISGESGAARWNMVKGLVYAPD
jgi:hypothetical protein